MCGGGCVGRDVSSALIFIWSLTVRLMSVCWTSSHACLRMSRNVGGVVAEWLMDAETVCMVVSCEWERMSCWFEKAWMTRSI